MKTNLEWYPIKRTEINVIAEARATKHIAYAKREVADKGYVAAYGGQAVDIAFRTEEELLKHLTYLITKGNIDFEDFDFVDEK